MPQRRPARRPANGNINDLTDLRVGLYVRVSDDDNPDKKARKADPKGYIAKQTEDQKKVGLEWAERVGANVVGIYSDPDYSAGRIATKPRPEFTRLKRDIEAGKMDLVWFWEVSRSQRRLDVFAELRDLCRAAGVRCVIRDRVYDPDDYKDMITPAILSVMAENESEQTSERVQRGKKDSAHRGRPAGKIPYGYTRIYNTTNREWERDVPNVFDSDGKAVDDSPAFIVREIFERIAGGHSITAIRRNLNDRGIRTQQGYQWDNSKVRYIATSPTYLGQRVHRIMEHCDNTASHDRAAKAVLKGVEVGWPPLIDAETFYAVQRILTDPARRTTRFGARPGTHLLSAVATCGECGAKLLRKKGPPKGGRPDEVNWMYVCRDRACIGIYQPDLDAYVERVMVAWLSEPDVVADLTAGEDSAAAKQARADAEQGRAELQQLYRDIKAATVSATIGTMSERRLQAAIAEAEQRVQDATVPQVLRGNVGPQAKASWYALDLETKRQIIRTVADIRVHRVGRGGGNKQVPVKDRVEWQWLLGPEAQPAEGGPKT